MKNVHSSDYGPDQEARDELAQFVPLFTMAEDLRTKIEEGRKALEEAFQLEFGTDLATLSVLDARLDEARTQFNDYARRVTLEGGRKKVFNGLVSTRIIRHAAEGLSEAALRKWVRDNDYLEVMRPTSEKNMQRMVVSALKRQDPTLLEVDVKAAIKMAIMTDSHGNKIFADSPVEVVEDVTQTSIDVFKKVLRTFEIEMTVAERDSNG